MRLGSTGMILSARAAATRKTGSVSSFISLCIVEFGELVTSDSLSLASDGRIKPISRRPWNQIS